MKNILSSCRKYIEIELTENNFLDGNLSFTHGFLPKSSPIDNLPSHFKIWEEYASKIPELFFSNNTQTELEKIPIIDVDLLSDEYLPRAATLLSLLASAYWRHGISNFLSLRNNIENGSLPESIETPWKKICIRLSRFPLPYQSGVDLFLNNFKLKPEFDYKLENIKIENLDVLVPSFKNEPERIFYMSFVEIHAITSPIVELVCEIEDLINEHSLNLDDRIYMIADKLDKISATIKKATKSLLKISPMKKSKTYCDPVLWSKTIGIFALPPSNYPQGGTSGTSTPILHVLDAIISRHKYESYYGEYVKNQGFKLLDIKTKGFVQRVANINIKEWILNLPESNNKITIINSFNQIINEYIGRDGFLDKHLSKVFNYLAIATLSGRNQSTSGHERYISSETWIEVCNHLKIAMEERTTLKNVKTIKSEKDVNFELSLISKDELAKHYKEKDGWILINKKIYDVTKFIQFHPGGVEIIKSYLGRDCTSVFNQISAHSKQKIEEILIRLEIGQLNEKVQNQSFLKYENLVYYLQKTHAILDMNNYKGDNIKSEIILKLQTYHLFKGDQLNQVKKHLNINSIETKKTELDYFLETQNLNQIDELKLSKMLDKANQYIANATNLVQELLDNILSDRVSMDENLIEIVLNFENDEKTQYNTYVIV